jgi:hypothetical protein
MHAAEVTRITFAVDETFQILWPQGPMQQDLAFVGIGR